MIYVPFVAITQWCFTKNFGRKRFLKRSMCNCWSFTPYRYTLKTLSSAIPPAVLRASDLTPTPWSCSNLPLRFINSVISRSWACCRQGLPMVPRNLSHSQGCAHRWTGRSAWNLYSSEPPGPIRGWLGSGGNRYERIHDTCAWKLVGSCWETTSGRERLESFRGYFFSHKSLHAPILLGNTASLSILLWTHPIKCSIYDGAGILVGLLKFSESCQRYSNLGKLLACRCKHK